MVTVKHKPHESEKKHQGIIALTTIATITMAITTTTVRITIRITTKALTAITQ